MPPWPRVPPQDIIGWIDEPTVELSQALMSHPDIKLILATGGPGMVKAAYSSGNPSLGVGAGNTPAVIDSSAHLKMAVNSILISKTFDNGMICASEQSVIVVDDIYDEVRAEFLERGAYLLNDDEKDQGPRDHSQERAAECGDRGSIHRKRWRNWRGSPFPKVPACSSGKSPTSTPTNPSPTRSCRRFWPCIAPRTLTMP
jgi:hypothetical protein